MRIHVRRAAAFAAATALLLSACAEDEGETEAAEVSPQECVEDLVERSDGEISAASLVERCGVSAAEAEAAAAATPAETTVPPSTAAPTTTTTEPIAPSEPAPTAVMPDIPCGTDLQLAQDLVQEAGVFLSRSEDATGADRFQAIDRNWTVVDAEPPAGTPIGEDEAVFYVVKDEEFSGC